MTEWTMHADAALTDIQAARKSEGAKALEHLRDAQSNLEKAIEALESEE